MAEEKKEGGFFSKIFGGKKEPEVFASGRDHTLPVPHLTRLEGTEIKPGQSIVIRGFATMNDRFDIYLGTGSNLGGEPESTERDNVVLHMGVDMDKKRISLNSLDKQVWGKEEKAKNPFKAGEEVNIRLRAHDNFFEIFGNHRELCQYDHRLPLTAITHIYISGAIELFSCSWEGKYYSIPYEAGVPGNFIPGRKLYVSAEPEKSVKNFCVNLMKGGDIAFHLSVRWNEKDVVRNNRINGEWQMEEREGPFPFHKKNSFDLVIACEQHLFKVIHDGQEICTFAHRVDPKDIDKIEISGDVQLQGVDLK
jgi:hypothetical protein